MVDVISCKRDAVWLARVNRCFGDWLCQIWSIDVIAKGRPGTLQVDGHDGTMQSLTVPSVDQPTSWRHFGSVLQDDLVKQCTESDRKSNWSLQHWADEADCIDWVVSVCMSVTTLRRANISTQYPAEMIALNQSDVMYLCDSNRYTTFTLNTRRSLGLPINEYFNQWMCTVFNYRPII